MLYGLLDTFPQANLCCKAVEALIPTTAEAVVFIAARPMLGVPPPNSSWTALVLWLLDGRIMLVSAVCRFSTTMAPPQSATVLALSVQLVPPEQTLRLVPNSVTDPASTARMACRCCKTLMVLAG